MDESSGNVKEVKVVVIGGMGHVDRSGLRIVEILRNHPGIIVVDDGDSVAKRMERIREMEDDILLSTSPHRSFRKSKGEKKRERSFARRIYGRDFV